MSKTIGQVEVSVEEDDFWSLVESDDCWDPPHSHGTTLRHRIIRNWRMPVACCFAWFVAGIAAPVLSYALSAN